MRLSGCRYLDGQAWIPALASLTPAPRHLSMETLFVCFRYGKGVVATAIHLLAERGRIDYDTHVADYWPAVGANGKGQITVRQLLKDTAGIPQLLLGCTVEELFNWDRTCDGIAALASMRQPGSRT